MAAFSYQVLTVLSVLGPSFFTMASDSDLEVELTYYLYNLKPEKCQGSSYKREFVVLFYISTIFLLHYITVAEKDELTSISRIL